MVIMSQEVGPKLWSKKELLVFTGIRLGGSWEKTKLCAGDLYLPAGSLSFQAALVIKNTPANARDVRNLGSLPGSGRSPGGGLAIHSSILAWKISSTGKPGQLHWSIVLRSVGCDLACMHAGPSGEISPQPCQRSRGSEGGGETELD